ncbi:MAG: helix-turn-helix transcriptional regulator [Oscillospiraceae bacterium]
MLFLAERQSFSARVYVSSIQHSRSVLIGFQFPYKNTPFLFVYLFVIALSYNWSFIHAVHAHPSYLNRCFKQRTGQNIVETITQKRMELAKTIMKQGIYKVYEISDNVGINYATYFSHVFRKYTGTSPKDYIDVF